MKRYAQVTVMLSSLVARGIRKGDKVELVDAPKCSGGMPRGTVWTQKGKYVLAILPGEWKEYQEKKKVRYAAIFCSKKIEESFSNPGSPEIDAAFSSVMGSISADYLVTTPSNKIVREWFKGMVNEMCYDTEKECMLALQTGAAGCQYAVFVTEQICTDKHINECIAIARRFKIDYKIILLGDVY
jgi:hypothetical protein